MKYLAQPQFGNKTVAIYEFSLTSTPVVTLSLPDNPNSALIYQDSSGVTPAFYLFVGLLNLADSSQPGYVNVYDLDAILKNGSSQPALATLTLMNDNGDTTIQPIGMAIQPGTGDLWVATKNGAGSYGTVNHFSRTGGGSDSWALTGTAALSFNNSGAIAGVVSNLAFDRHGNLWLTTFDGGGNFLCCITAPVAANSLFVRLENGPPGGASNSLPSTLLCPQLESLGFQPPPATAPPLQPFSGPEGIAFDPAGNLWLSNNNDEGSGDVNPNPGGGGGGGSLLKISGAWLDSLLYPTLTPQSGGLMITTATTFNGASPVTTYYVNDYSQFGGLCFDGYTLYINDEANYGPSGAVVWQIDTASASLAALQGSFQWSQVTTTNPGNGSMSICNHPYPNPTLTIRDNTNDIGGQPDTKVDGGASGVLWESPDILVSNSSAAPAGISYGVPMPSGSSTPSFTGSGTVTTGSDAYLSIRVTNFGSAGSTDTAILKVYWGFASTGLNWPAPWDGSMYFNNQIGLPLGGVIGEMQLQAIPANLEIYVQMVWPGTEIPNPADYLQAGGGVVAASEHFCLLARIESTSVYSFGMSHPEEVGPVTGVTALHDNVLNNSAIGWRNIAIVPVTGGVGIGPWIRLPILGANYGAVSRQVSFGIQTLNRAGRVEPVKAKVIVKAEGRALEHLRAAEFEQHRFRDLGEGRFEMHDTERGMAKIHLPANELLPFTIQFTPEDERLRDFAVRVIQYVQIDGIERVVGGQTFVIGEVERYYRG